MRLMLYVDDEPGGVLFCVDFVGMFAVFEANNKLGLSFECAAGTHFRHRRPYAWYWAEIWIISPDFERHGNVFDVQV